MNRLRRQALGTAGAVRTVVLSIGLLVLAAAPAHAQLAGYGWPGYGSAYGGPVIGYGAPGFGYGYGYPGYGYGYGYPGYGYGYGYPGYGYGYGYGYPGYGYRYGYGYGQPWIGTGYGVFGLTPPGYANPLFGLGLTPLGVQSALTESFLLGRGVARSGAVPPAYAPSR